MTQKKLEATAPDRSKPDNDLCLVITSCPDEDTAKAIANALIEPRAAACVKVIPGVQSVYVWQEKVCRDHEHQVLIKTLEHKIADCLQIISGLHPCEVPEFSVLKIAECSEAYSSWLRSTVKL